MSEQELHERLERGREFWRANQAEIKELRTEVGSLREACAEKDKQIEGLEQLADRNKQEMQSIFDLLSDLLADASTAARITAEMKDKLKPYHTEVD